MEDNNTQTLEQVQEQILITKISDSHNYERIQKLQQLLDKMIKEK